jgi:hypothetical protein
MIRGYFLKDKPQGIDEEDVRYIVKRLPRKLNKKNDNTYELYGVGIRFRPGFSESSQIILNIGGIILTKPEEKNLKKAVSKLEKAAGRELRGGE